MEPNHPQDRVLRRNRIQRHQSLVLETLWQNVLLVLVKCLGYDVIIQKPPKARTTRTLPYIPCVRISRGGVVFYDVHDTRTFLDQRARAGSGLSLLECSRYIRECAFNAALTRVMAAGQSDANVQVRLVNDSRLRERMLRRYETSPRIDTIAFGGVVFNKKNIIRCGTDVFNWCVSVYAHESKNVDLELVPFPFEQAFAPLMWSLQCPEETRHIAPPDVPESSHADEKRDRFQES